MKNIIAAAVLATLAGVFFNPIIQQSRYYNRCVELSVEGEIFASGYRITAKKAKFIQATIQCRGN